MPALTNGVLANGKKASIEWKEGYITAVGRNKKINGAEDLDGKLILPGCIDVHVHFREPGGEEKEDWLTGSRAAVAGGVTSIIDMPNNAPAITDNQTLDMKREMCKKSLVNYGLHLGATPNNLAAVQEAKNIAGVKIYVGSSTGNLLVAEDEDIESLLSVPGVQFLIHAEDESLIQKQMLKYADEEDASVHSKIRTPEAAVRALKRVLKLAEKTEARVHICHVSTTEEVAVIERAKEAGLAVTCEASPHHLFLNTSAYQKFGNFVKVNPPLRTAQDNAALWKALQNGVIDIVATDHAPHTSDEKWQNYRKAPSGIPEVQTVLPLLLNAVQENKLTLERLAEAFAKKPAEIFHIERRGELKKGNFADITIVDMEKTHTFNKREVKSKCGWSPYEGWELKGWPVRTYVNGNLVYNNGVIHNEYPGRELTYGTV